MYIFGLNVREKQRGTYVDLCASCNGLAPFVVFTRNEVTHFYFMPLDDGDDYGTAMRCLQCQKVYEGYDPKRVAYLLQKGAEKGRTIDEVYRATHPRLVYVLDVCSWAEKGAHALAESEKSTLLECVKWIRLLESRHLDTMPEATTLAGWEKASDREKRTLRETLHTRALKDT